MGDLLDGLGKLLIEFSLRRLVGLVALVILLIMALVVYERMTSGFELSRVERILAITEALNARDAARGTTDSAMERVQGLMRRQLVEAAERTPLRLRLPQQLFPSFDVGVFRFLSGAGIWFLLVFAISWSDAPSKATGEEAQTKARREQEESAAQAAVIALASGVISIFLPLRMDWWFLAFAYPAAALVVGLGLLAVPDILRSRRMRRASPADSGVRDQRPGT